ncbi:hypothetical protein [Burkholderia vietnamiensis]|uniref:hypothetical protein n=1 Tax=Burkholderia vietnamiensis TaxID=60552 RepID=UPI00264AB57D|nr:hypothetical protein [Burkholderia vietnamiensis]MDN8071135.1 hypothetical protein [Burkholderia vietnamiensis]
MTTNAYGGYTVDQLREFIRHHYDAEHGGDNIDELTNDSSASVKIVRDLLDAIEPQQDGDLLRPIARWVYNAVRVNLDLLHGICSDFGCPQGEDVATWLRARLAGVPAPCMCSGLGPCEQCTDGSCRRDSAAVPAPADERAAWGRARESLAVAMAGFSSRSGSRDFNAALSVLDAITEPGLPLSWLRSARASAAETGATVGWAWISPTGHVSRFTADFGGKHDQLVQGWKVRPVAFCDAIANETVAEGADALAHEVWSAAQRAPGEGIEDAVQRIAAILSRSPAMAAEGAAGLFVKRSKFGPWVEIEKPEPGAVTPYTAPQPAQADAQVGLTDAERALIERAEERLRGRSPEDASVANGLLEVLIAHPGQPEPRASAGVIAAARAVIEADRAQTLTTEHIDALDNAIKIQHGELNLPEPRAEVTDTARLDWLCERVVNVRHPLLYGSRDMFWASPTDDDSGHSPSDIRAQIDAARAGEKQ